MTKYIRIIKEPYDAYQEEDKVFKDRIVVIHHEQSGEFLTENIARKGLGHDAEGLLRDWVGWWVRKSICKELIRIKV